jgi:NAD(P)-dependent dehydrogenase (short-subunit alcohol dehydrogenase family)
LFYSATKFAVAGLTENIAKEVKEFGIAAAVEYPGISTLISNPCWKD